MNLQVKVVKLFVDKVAVMWSDDEGRRLSIIPRHVLLGDMVNEEILYAAPPYGVDWVLLLGNILNSKNFIGNVAYELERSNIWTLDDIVSNPSAVIAGLQRAYGLDFQTLIVSLKQWENDNK